MTKVELTVKIKINFMTELAMKMTNQEPGPEYTWDHSKEPSKNKRMASIERSPSTAKRNAQKQHNDTTTLIRTTLKNIQKAPH